MNFNSKENGGKKFFLPNQSIKTVYPKEENVFMCLKQASKFAYFGGQTLSWNKKLLLPNQSIYIMYPNEYNMFIVPNNKKNKGYYKNPSLSHLTDELWF